MYDSKMKAPKTIEQVLVTTHKVDYPKSTRKFDSFDNICDQLASTEPEIEKARTTIV